jgi:predicted lipoprotein with Yx(FWY)xxD motif
MRKTRRRFLAAVGASLAIAGCQDGGAGPTPGSPGAGDTPGAGGDESPAGDGVGDGTEGDGMDDGTEEDGVGDETEEDGAGDGTEEDGADGAEDATVQVAEHDEYGEILVDSEGMTLYMFDSDEQGAGESTCTGGCIDNWPLLTVDGDPVAGDGVDAELSTFEHGETGDTQVAANGWPLYYFTPDESPGDANGQGANDVWWLVDPSGAPIRSSGDGGTSNGMY